MANIKLDAQGELFLEEEIERFQCEADDGTTFMIVAIQEYRLFSSLSGPKKQIKGMKRLELLDGSSFVNFIDEQHFEIVNSGVVVRRL